MDSVRDILAEVFRKARGNETLENNQLVCAYWATAVGQQIATHTKPVQILDKRLVVDVDGQEWLCELAPMGRRIADKVNLAIGSNLLEDIIFRISTPQQENSKEASP